MWHRGIRRLCALVLVVVFGMGPALHGPQAAEMAVKMAAAAGADMAASGDCHGCDGDASDLACAPVCASPAATLSAAPAAFPPPMGGAAVFADTLGAGRSAPPDPFPPKLPILV